LRTSTQGFELLWAKARFETAVHPRSGRNSFAEKTELMPAGTASEGGDQRSEMNTNYQTQKQRGGPLFSSMHDELKGCAASVD